MKIFPILGIAAIAIGASSSLAQAATIKKPRPPININNEFPVPATPPIGNLVNNPGFETGNFNGYSLNDPSGQSVVDDGSIDYPPHTGTYSAALGTINGFGFLSQMIPTVAGTKYSLSYFLQNDGGTPNEFITIVGNDTLFDQVSIPAQNYTPYNFTFTANSTSTQLQFQYRQDPLFFHLDDISVVPVSNVPEPSGLLSTIAFGVGVGYSIKRQSQSQKNLN